MCCEAALLRPGGDIRGSENIPLLLPVCFGGFLVS